MKIDLRALPALACLLLLAACGGTSDTPTASTSPSTSASVSQPSAGSSSASPAPSPGVSVPANAAKFSDGIEYDDKVTVEVKQIQNKGTTTTFTVEINNKGTNEVGGPIDVQSSYGSGYTAAAPVDGGTPLAAPVAAGTKATGKYSFTIPSASRGKVYLDVALGTDRDHAQFAGSVK